MVQDMIFIRSQNDDYKAWAKGLKRAGYATNPKYASMLIRTIEENKLYIYDEVVLGPQKEAT